MLSLGKGLSNAKGSEANPWDTKWRNLYPAKTVE